MLDMNKYAKKSFFRSLNPLMGTLKTTEQRTIIQSAIQNSRHESQPNGRLQTRVTGQLSAAVLNWVYGLQKRLSRRQFSVLTMLIWLVMKTIYALMSPVSVLGVFLL